jgi:fermentation-respiration switch protein FrsA (DUF1100 family)
MVECIGFEVGGEQVVGHLHLPSGAGPYPALVVAGPMTSVKEQVTGVYAAALALRGIAALAIDHRHYGESGGEPRGLEHWQHKVEDLRAAIDWLASRPDIDPERIGGAGVCLGCGYMAHAAAAHPLIRALGLVAGYYRDPRAMRESDPEGFDAKVEQGRAARQAYEATGRLDVIPAAALEGDAAMSTTDTVDYYTRRAAHPNYRNAFAVMSREHFLPFDVQAAAERLRVPTLMVHSERALSPDWARAFAKKLASFARLDWVASAGQTDFYDDPALVAEAADRLSAHYQTELSPRAT